MDFDLMTITAGVSHELRKWLLFKNTLILNKDGCVKLFLGTQNRLDFGPDSQDQSKIENGRDLTLIISIRFLVFRPLVIFFFAPQKERKPFLAPFHVPFQTLEFCFIFDFNFLIYSIL